MHAQAWPLYVAMVLLGISVGGFACVSSLASQVLRATPPLPTPTPLPTPSHLPQLPPPSPAVSHHRPQVVPAHVVGEAQGLLTSMKALTEGFGPLLVSLLLHAFEGSVLPGAPRPPTRALAAPSPLDHSLPARAGAPWLLCGACAAVAALLGRRLESTIAAHATSSTAHTQRYAASPPAAAGAAEGPRLASLLL